MTVPGTGRGRNSPVRRPDPQNAGVRRLSSIAVVIGLAAGCGGSHSAHTTSAAAGHQGARPPSKSERGAITRLVHHEWQYGSGFSAVRKLGLHGVVTRIRISQRDPHFAEADVAGLDSHGKQSIETAELGLTLVAGKWTVAIGPGTDLSEICTAASPRPLVDLFCG